MKEPLYCQPACNTHFAAAFHSHSAYISGLAQADVGMQGLCAAAVHGTSMCTTCWATACILSKRLTLSIALGAQSLRVMLAEVAKQSKKLEHIDR